MVSWPLNWSRAARAGASLFGVNFRATCCRPQSTGRALSRARRSFHSFRIRIDRSLWIAATGCRTRRDGPGREGRGGRRDGTGRDGTRRDETEWNGMEWADLSSRRSSWRGAQGWRRRRGLTFFVRGLAQLQEVRLLLTLFAGLLARLRGRQLSGRGHLLRCGVGVAVRCCRCLVGCVVCELLLAGSDSECFFAPLQSLGSGRRFGGTT